MKSALAFEILLGFALALAAPASIGQNYPSKPVRFLVGFSAGGNTDVPARIVASKLGEIWGTPAIVENRPGAGGNIAAAIAAKAPADGYTLLVCQVASHGINPAIYKELPYDPLRDFAPISRIGFVANVLIVGLSSPLRTVADLVAFARANTGKLIVASAGIGTSQHLSIELLGSMAKIEIVHVPYKGGAPALTDVMGGQVPAMVGGMPTVVGAIKAAKVRPLGVTSSARSALMPDVPAIAETLPRYEVTSWTGLCAPTGVPSPILAKLNADLHRALSAAEIKRSLAEQGVEAAPTSAEQFTALIKSEIAKWATVTKTAGIKAE